MGRAAAAVRGRWDRWTGRLGARVELLRSLALVPRRLLAATAVLAGASALLPVAFAILTGVLAGTLPDAVGDGLGSSAGQRALVLVGVLSGVLAAEQLIAPFLVVVRDRVQRAVDGAVRARLMAAALEPPGIAHLEDPERRDEFARAMRLEWHTPGQATGALVGLAPRYVQALASALLVAIVFSWWVALALLAAALTIRSRYQTRCVRFMQAFFDQMGALRETDYLFQLGLSPDAAKDLRVLNLERWLEERYQERVDVAVADAWRERSRGIMGDLRWLYLLAAVALAGALALAAGAARDGSLDLAQLVMVAQGMLGTLAVARFFEETIPLAFGVLGMPAARSFVAAMRELSASGGAEPPPAAPAREIRFERVRFAYAGASAPVLDGLDLTIPAGRSLAIVGENGAGKTTLAKLLCRLYEPTGGRLLLDGADLAALDARAWQARVAAIFQDFPRLALTAAENIRFGDGAPHDEAAVAAAAQAAGAAATIEGLSRGYATPLARGYADGVDLSGGQWQTVALARVLYAAAHGRRVLILDEPTSNLDARAEAELFERLLAATAGLTTILISHRFSTVRRADRICVLDGGRVAELGTHDELMARDGRYAAMFRVQAARFAASGEDA